MKSTLLLSLLLCVDSALSLRINEPRVESEKEENGDNKEVFVKLPENVHQIIQSQKADRARIHASILGLKPDAAEGEHLRRILGNNDQEQANDYNGKENGSKTSNAVLTTSTTVGPFRGIMENSDDDRRRNDGVHGPNRDNADKSVDSSRQPNSSTSTSLLPSVLFSSQDFWALAWEAHLYFSSTLFILLAIYCTINVLRLHTFPRLFPKGYFVCINLCLVLLAVLRPVYLLVDPYNANDYWSRAVAYLLLDSGFPALSSAFSILFLALLRATQVELVTCQRARSLAIFCVSHFALSMTIDFVIGVKVELRYLILLCQGFFIVWCLLLSAGYFYIYSSMRKVSERYPVDLLRFGVQSNSAMKWANNESYDNNNTHNNTNNRMNTLNSGGGLHRNSPLSKAIKLTLGVALLGSLIGGVQLFGMIKMLGLQQQDLKIGYNKWAWLGYQISMRILEVAMATLIAVIATTPLTTDNSVQLSPLSSNQSTSKYHRSARKKSCFRLFCCCSPNETGVLREPLEEEIYSEICSNNRSVRNVVNQDLNLVYGTLMGPRVVSSTVNTAGTPIDQLVLSTQQQIEFQAENAHSSTGANSLSSSNKNTSTLQRNNVAEVGSNRLESGNRPSSMLYNEGGFVRFRMTNDPTVGQNDILKQSTNDLTQEGDLQASALSSSKEKSIRASQSFDESVLLNEQVLLQKTVDQSFVVQQQNPSPIYKSIESLTQQQPQQREHQQALLSQSELDNLEVVYAAGVPSRCSSVSATQSFDMRMYGKLNPSINIPNPQAFVASTLRRTEPAVSRLENPYYYYGSTRNQKKKKGNKFLSKPRPPLPSQRQPFELQQLVKRKTGSSNKTLSAQRQASLQHQMECDELEQQQQRQQLQQQLQQQQCFQRSRSLGGYYTNGNVVIDSQRAGTVKQPLQSRGSFNVNPNQPGSMTPMSYARWQHVQRHNQQQQQRQRHFSSGCQRDDGLSGQNSDKRMSDGCNRGRQQQQVLRGEIRGLVGNSGGQISFTNNDVLSPILTDHEDQKQHHNPRFSMSSSSSSSLSLCDKRAKNGSEAGLLADNEEESEASFVVDKRDLDTNPKSKEKKIISPLEYSARLKLQNQQENNAQYSPLTTEQESQLSESEDDEHDYEEDDYDDGDDCEDDTNDNSTKLQSRYQPLVSPTTSQDPSYRWDGTQMTKNSSGAPSAYP